jgi:chromosome segregation ATPase
MSVELEEQIKELQDRLESSESEANDLKDELDELEIDLKDVSDRENDLENQRDDLASRLGIAEQFIQWVDEVYPQARREYNAVYSIVDL